MSAPRVSICMPAYNHGRFLRASIASALAQTFADTEVVVSDNASTDDTAAVVRELAAGDARLRYEPTTAHLPMDANFNRCVALARGEYVKFLAADDLLEPGCVARLLDVLQRRPQARLAACARRVMGTGAPRVRRYAATEVHCPGEQAIRRCFFHGNLIGEPTAVLFRRADAGAGFNAEYLQLVDLEYWFRLLETGELAFVPEVLCTTREHEAQATRRSLATGRVSADKERLFAAYAGRPYLRGSLAERLLWDFRMAWSIERERAAGSVRAPSSQVYFRGLGAPMKLAARAALLAAG